MGATSYSFTTKIPNSDERHNYSLCEKRLCLTIVRFDRLDTFVILPSLEESTI